MLERGTFLAAPYYLREYPLLHGPYAVPAVRVGRTATCLLRGKAKVCGWTEGRIPGPCCGWATAANTTKATKRATDDLTGTTEKTSAHPGRRNQEDVKRL